MVKILSAIGVSLLTCVHGAVDSDLVTELPGFGKLPSKHYSGYIDVPTPNGTAHVHYWLAMNKQDQANAPTVVWQQGGPGGSSLIGFFTELGPLTLNDYSFQTDDYNRTGIPSVFENPHAWYNVGANFLFVEHPAPTGFSYCEGDCYWDDSTQAAANYDFYKRFFAAYPELAKNRFMMTGESYAGVLVPTVALLFLKNRTPENKDMAPWNLEGFQLGNDCPGNRVFTCTPYSGWIGTQVALDFRYNRGMIKETTYQQINQACAGHWGTFEAPPEPCKSLLENPINPVISQTGNTDNMGGGYFIYDTCGTDLLVAGPDGLMREDRAAAERAYIERASSRPAAATAATAASTVAKGEYPLDDGQYACGQERASTQWLNRPDVQSAIHVKLVGKSQFSFSTGLNYTFSAFSLLDDYKNTLIPNLRITQYSGDADQCVPYVGTQRWIESLELTEARPWRPWVAEEMVVGYVTQYAENNFTFATMRDAGHMVPRYKPKAAFEMFSNFFHKQPF